jgi:hypothetical protein
VLIYIFALLLAGCGSAEKKQPKPLSEKFLIITGEKGMNHDSALSVDIVQVYDPHIWNELAKMKASEYFKRKKWVLAKNLKVWSLEVTEDFWCIGFALKNYQDKSEGTILFASYQEDKLNKIPLQNYKDCTLLKLGVDQIVAADAYNQEVADATAVEPTS